MCDLVAPSRALEELADVRSAVREAQAEHLAGVERTAAAEGDDRVDRCVRELVDRLVEPVDRRIRGDPGVDSNAPLADQRRNPSGEATLDRSRRADEQHVIAGDAVDLPDDAGPEDDARRVVLFPGLRRHPRSSAMKASLFSIGVRRRPARVGARRLATRTSSIAGPSACAKTSDRLAEPCDALDGLGRRVAAGRGDCAQIDAAAPPSAARRRSRARRC